ncbi:phosphatase PAP2 family protein [Ramlibacter sp. PS3R-8]|uniref:phosphatase PAP2 family protein n=1 Tax=Ramlibacter sp. PS3R-8 TaxID=3133437 RepID=UPI0030B64F9F
MGYPRSYYATPGELRYRPWALDITPDDAGNPPFLFDVFIDPYAGPAAMEWQTGDWDPALRFWSLNNFDPQLGEWLKGMDTSRPSIMAAREMAVQSQRWGADSTTFLETKAAAPSMYWIEPGDLAWRPATAAGTAAIKAEIVQLQQLMTDDRERYLAEIEAQADGLADYMTAFIGADGVRHPWTIELINCGLAMTNVAYMRWKSLYKRVRPSVLCPALALPFGPPAHPAFPSGHSTAGHFIALLLLEIPGLLKRFGKSVTDPVTLQTQTGMAVVRKDLDGTQPINAPLLWLAARLAKNRERLGAHYASDSFAGRHLAATLWHTLLHETRANKKIDCPSLDAVIVRAQAEWPV